MWWVSHAFHPNLTNCIWYHMHILVYCIIPRNSVTCVLWHPILHGTPSEPQFKFNKTKNGSYENQRRQLKLLTVVKDWLTKSHKNIPTIMVQVADQKTGGKISITTPISTPWTWASTSSAVPPSWWWGTVTITSSPHSPSVFSPISKMNHINRKKSASWNHYQQFFSFCPTSIKIRTNPV